MFIQFGIKDFIDILLVAIILYETYRLLRRSGAKNLFWGILIFIAAWFLVCFIFKLELTGALFDRIISVGAIAIIVIFQNEIRNLFYRLGARFSSFQLMQNRQQEDDTMIQQVILACRHLADQKTGALIVLAGNQNVKEYTDTGEEIEAMVSAPLLENIFFKNTPLHDGAVIITDNRIKAAACILPVSKQDLPLQFGLRHRAALGISERENNTLAIVVSEETGHIAIAQNSHIKEVNNEELVQLLYQHFSTNATN